MTHQTLLHLLLLTRKVLFFFQNLTFNYPLIRRYESNRAPTELDIKNFDLGDEWLDSSTNDWYKLSSKSAGSANWCNICFEGAVGGIDFLETDDEEENHPSLILKQPLECQLSPSLQGER